MPASVQQKRQRQRRQDARLQQMRHTSRLGLVASSQLSARRCQAASSGGLSRLSQLQAVALPVPVDTVPVDTVPDTVPVDTAPRFARRRTRWCTLAAHLASLLMHAPVCTFRPGRLRYADSGRLTPDCVLFTDWLSIGSWMQFAVSLTASATPHQVSTVFSTSRKSRTSRTKNIRRQCRKKARCHSTVTQSEPEHRHSRGFLCFCCEHWVNTDC